MISLLLSLLSASLQPPKMASTMRSEQSTLPNIWGSFFICYLEKDRLRPYEAPGLIQPPAMTATVLVCVVCAKS